MPLSPRSLKRNQSLQEQAYQALKTAILSGELAPGQRLVEVQLAKQLQVSRTPIREAMQLLEHENLIANDNDTLRVATISVTDAAQLYDCRIALEQLSVAEACQNATKSQLKELEQMVQQAEKLVESKPTQLTSFRLLDLDYRFHRLIAKSSGNPWLVSLLDRVFDKMQLLRIQTTKNNPEVLEIRTEHREIYEPVRDRNVQAAVTAVREHLTASKERVIKEIEQLQQDNQTAQ
ncbi:GntR family transcriptional regulator [Synechocystis sp. PCC 7509]|uniref:GntR family transcriptional regulator n=1 Tax=Synechocystis sp. PCC 7509 TaxID=927677 RepID=UPI0002AD0778|nr:GntR family transcriptional regulator [Synechocystis sp. PCC 7509]